MLLVQRARLHTGHTIWRICTRMPGHVIHERWKIYHQVSVQQNGTVRKQVVWLSKEHKHHLMNAHDICRNIKQNIHSLDKLTNQRKTKWAMWENHLPFISSLQSEWHTEHLDQTQVTSTGTGKGGYSLFIEQKKKHHNNVDTIFIWKCHWCVLPKYFSHTRHFLLM